jgi:hypothetical protein
VQYRVETVERPSASSRRSRVHCRSHVCNFLCNCVANNDSHALCGTRGRCRRWTIWRMLSPHEEPNENVVTNKCGMTGLNQSAIGSYSTVVTTLSESNADTTLLSTLSVKRALAINAATSSRAIAPHTLLASVTNPLPVAGSFVNPPGRMMTQSILSCACIHTATTSTAKSGYRRIPKGRPNENCRASLEVN